MKVFSVALVAALGLGVSSQPFSCYPRMRDQPSIKPFERAMPPMPDHLAPFAGPSPVTPTREQLARRPNPVKPTSEAVSLGRIYYGYYCAMCHGQGGAGDGLVGVSYVPAPTDLTSARVQHMSDGMLAWAMVAGAGHEPVLESTVPLDRRWHIALFLRTFAHRSAAPHASVGRPRAKRDSLIGEMPQERPG